MGKKKPQYVQIIFELLDIVEHLIWVSPLVNKKEVIEEMDKWKKLIFKP